MGSGFKSSVLAATVLTGLVAAADVDAEQPKSDDATQLQEIVVTSQKKSQLLSKVPMSVSAITEDTLEKTGIKDAESLGRLSPGLTFTQNSFSGAPEVSIRGLSSPVGASTTGIYIDDTPIQNRAVIAGVGSAFPRLFDLDRVEVLRGPQGTLFGAGSEGGTIRFLTPKPSLSQFSGYVTGEASYTDHGDPSFEGGGAVGGPLIKDKLGFRLSLWEQSQGGYIDRLDPTTGATVGKNVNNSHATVGRLALLFQPTDRLSITPSIYIQDFYKANPDHYFEDAGLFKSLYKINQPSDDKFSLYDLSIQYNFDAFAVKSITSYYVRSQSRINDYSYFEPAAYQGGPYLVFNNGDPYNYISTQRFNSPEHDFNEELRFSSNDGAGGRFSWVGGVFYSLARQGSNQYIVEPIGVITMNDFGMTVDQFFGAPDGPVQWIEEQKFKTEEVAAFGELNYNVTRALKLTVGLRASHTKFSFIDRQDGPEAGGPRLYTGSTQEDPITPKFGASYQVDPNWMVYATAAKGYRIGGANSALASNPTCVPSLQALGLTDAPRTYGSDYVWSYEIGDKQKLLGGRASVAASAFWIDWSKIQGAVFVQSCGLQYLTNFGSAVSRGLDFQGQVRIVRGLTLSGAAGYTDARYAQTSHDPGGTLTALKGDELQNTPAWSLSAALQYDFHLFDQIKSFARIDYQYQGPYAGAPAAGVNGEDPGVRHQPGSDVVSLRAGVSPGAWELNAYVNNLLDTHRSLQRIHDIPGEEASFSVPDGLYRNVTYRPLTAGVSAKYRF